MKKGFGYVGLTLIFVIFISCSTDSGPPVYVISTSVSPSEAGTVDPSSIEIEEGKNLSLRATAHEGWEFTEWTGDVVSTDNPLTVTANGDKSLTANFVDIRSDYSVNISLSNGVDDIDIAFGQIENPVESSQQIPPSPPENSFHAYFQRSSKSYWKDFRENYLKEVNWQFIVQTSVAESVTINWQIEENGMRGTLTLENTRTNEEIDMQELQEIVVNQETTFSIKYRFEE